MIEDLKHRFDLPGVTFYQRDQITLMRLENRHGSVTITPLGATVLGYRPRGEDEVLWVSDTARFDGNRPVRGGIPVCWPWFGPHPTDPAQKAHGFARHALWHVESVTADADTSRAVLQLEPDERIRGIWPWAFSLRLTVTLGETLRLDLTGENRSQESWTVSEALHSYFSVWNGGDLHIRGLEDLHYWDKQAGGTRGVQNGPLHLSPPFDRVYFDHDGSTVIDDGSRRIRIDKRGSASTVVWNPGPEGARAFEDMPDGAWREMVCVETANAIDNAYTLHPGESHTLTTILSV